MNSSVILFFFTLLCFRQNSVAQSNNDTAKLLNKYLTIQEKRIGFNGVVLIAKNDTVLYKEAIGKASFELNIPLTINPKFKIASISKSFTAMLIMLGVSEGKVNLNDSSLGFYRKKVNIKFTFQSDQEGFITGLPADRGGQILTFNKE